MFWNNSRTFYNYLKWLARVSPSKEQEQTLSVYCHFHSFIDLPENTTLDTETMLKTALELLEINYVQLSTQDLKPSANNNTHCSLAKTITRCIKFTKRVELWIHFLQLDDIFEPLVRMNSLYGKRWVKRFLSPHTTAYRKQTAHEYKYSQTRLIWTLRGPWNVSVLTASPY